jgi:hypothetical protein
MALDGFNVVCLEPGADNPKKHAPVPAPEPPEGFVDNTVYRYRIDSEGDVNMDFERAINIAIACVMASHMENKDKRETIEKLRELEDKLEEFRDDGWLDE